MTEKDRFDLFMSTTLGKALSDEFKTYLLANGFFSAPASTKYHGAYEGGLFDHSFAVMNFLVDLSAKNKLKWQKTESPLHRWSIPRPLQNRPVPPPYQGNDLRW